MNNIKGFYHETTSLFNGKPIVIVFTGFSRKSKNSKIGENFIQAWILDKSSNPFAISKARKDQSVCGSCPQRHSLAPKDPSKKDGKAGCYVNILQAPYAIWKALKRGAYVKLDLNNPEHVKLLTDITLRLTAYGDLGAVPFTFIDNLMTTCNITRFTGYTHAFKMPHVQPYKKYLMASVENEEEALLAKNLGWRYFRVRGEKEEKLQKEMICPASAEKNFKLNCEQCLACSGTSRNWNNVVIYRHGSFAKKIKTFNV